MGSWRKLLSVCLAVLAGCDSPDSSPPDGPLNDAAVDVSADAPVDEMVDEMIDAGPDAPVDPTPEVPTITVGASDRILLIGTLVTPETVINGELLVIGTTIACIGAAGECATQAAGATVIDTKGVISPGLVDTHNHILFDIFDGDDWLPTQIYQNHDQWPNEPRYVAMLDVKQCLVNDSQGKPAWCAQTPYGTSAGSLRCEVNKFGELKALVAGTTSIVGLPGTSAGCFGSLARSVDVAQNGLGADKIQTSALFPPASGTRVCQNIDAGTTDAFIVHVGEGTDEDARAEFVRLGTVTTPDDCLYAPQVVITHGTAFTSAEFTVMAEAGMKLVWSPASNVALYGQTTDIPTALDAGVMIALAPDWSMGGSQNLLDELRFANQWDDTHWGDQLSSRELVKMVTVNGARALALDGRLGKLEVGHLADIAVFAGNVANPYDAILAATPANVRLVMVGGVVLYGDQLLQGAGPTLPGCESLDVCGEMKFLCTATPATTNKLGQTYAEIATILGEALLTVDSLTPDDGFQFAPLTPLVRCP